MAEKIMLLDGHSLLNRAFYGLPDLTNADGLHTICWWHLIEKNQLFVIYSIKRIKGRANRCRENCGNRFL